MLLLQYHQWWRHLLILIFVLTRAGDGLGSYIVEVTVHSYQNPTGRCVGCQEGQEAGCCDEDFIRPANEMCPITLGIVCDLGLTYCARSIGEQECEDKPSIWFISNINSIDFDSLGSLLGLDNPVVVEREEPWNGIEFVLVPRDCNGEECSGDRFPIDDVIVTIDVPVGTESSEQTYSGVADIAEFVVSFDVRCADGYYEGDCTTECPDFVSCEGCGLPGYTGEFCQFPTENCSEAYCNGNGECVDGRPVCNCEPGFTGERCEDDIDECEGIDCSGNGRCEDRVNGFVCVCDPGYTGERCEDNIDQFEGTECSNSSRCEEDPGSTGETSEGAAIGAIVGGVVGAVVGIMIAVVLIVVVVSVVRRGGHICAESKIKAGGNPAYGITGNTQESHPIPTQGSNHTAATTSYDLSTSVQEREFDNPIYSSTPLIYADDDPYTVSDSPPSNVYDRVADNNPVQLGVAIPPCVGTGTGSGHNTSYNYYSTVKM